MLGSIKVKLISGLVLLITVMMAAILVLASFNFTNHSYDSFRRSLASELSHVEYSINLFIDESLKNADMLARHPLGKQIDAVTTSHVDTATSRKSTVDFDDAVGQQVVELFSAMQESHPAYVEVFMGNKHGAFVSSLQTSDMPAGYDPRIRPWYQEALPITDRSSLSKAYLSTTGEAVASVTRTVVRGNEVLGVVGIDISLAILTTLVKSIELGETGYMVLIQDDGVILADPRSDANNFKNVSEIDDPYLSKLFALDSGNMQIEKEGTDYLGSVVTSSETGWKLVGIVEESEIRAPVNNMIMNLILLGLASLVVIAVLLWLFTNGVIIKPLGMITKALNRISEGDYAIRTKHSRQDEIGEILDTLNDTSAKLESSMNEVEHRTLEAQEKAAVAEHATREAEEARQRAESAKSEGMLHAAQKLESIVNIIGTASEGLSTQIGQSSRGAEVQAVRVTETATAMEEMNASVLEVAQSASDAANSADNAKAQAVNGDAIVEKLTDLIDQINTKALDMKSSLDQLGQQAQGIGQIMDVITDIADQTNLLALNAAIEAARAGEAGRGFAVVADEVRKLAEKTMHATKEVGDAVVTIQSGTQTNITYMEETASVVTEANNMAGQAGESLREIVGIVEATADQVRSIATASEEQSAASEEINHSVSEVNAISKETSTAMTEASQAVLSLSEQAQKLQQLIDEMQREAQG